MLQLLSDLEAAQVGDIRLNEPLAPYTTWKIGGPADALVIPATKDKLVETLRLISIHRIPWLVIGRGSNLLVGDNGFRGVVVKIHEALEHIGFEGELVYAGAACSLVKLARMAAKEGLTGLEFAGGIPGSVGGAVYMNAGAHGSDVSCILKQAEVLLPSGDLITMKQSDLQYAYRHSLLQNSPGIVTEAVFELRHGDRKEIAAGMAAYRESRVRTQPLQFASAGSVFRNPDNGHAAKLIESAGLKGRRIGGVEVSAKHANFIVNVGQGTAQDVLTLIALIRSTVKQQYGIELVPEVLVVGES